MPRSFSIYDSRFRPNQLPTIKYLRKNNPIGRLVVPAILETPSLYSLYKWKPIYVKCKHELMHTSDFTTYRRDDCLICGKRTAFIYAGFEE